MHLMLSWLSCVFRNLGFRSVSRISGAESLGHPFFFFLWGTGVVAPLAVGAGY